MSNATIRVSIRNEDDETILRIKKQIEEIVRELENATVSVTIQPERTVRVRT